MLPQDTFLKKFVEKIEQDDNIIACFLGGSMAKESHDKFSDVDLRIVVDRNHLEEYQQKRYDLLESLGNSIFRDPSGLGDSLAIVYFDSFKVDLFVVSKGELSPNYWLQEIKILKDSDNFLHNIKEKSAAEQPFSEKEVSDRVVHSYAGLIDAVSRYQRGELLQCLDNLNEVRKTILLLYDLRAGNQPLFERRAEMRLPADFKQALRVGHSRDGLRAAIKKHAALLHELADSYDNPEVYRYLQEKLSVIS